MSSSVVELPRVTGACPEFLTAAVRRAARSGGSWQETSDRVVAALRGRLPAPADLLSPAQLAGDPAGYQTYLVHAEPDGSFSIAVMVWLPGQRTPVHDHVAWCVSAVLQGTEYEETFRLVPGSPEDRHGHLESVARNANPLAAIAGFAPPGDIHRVRNIDDGVAVSPHVYGADITRLGGSCGAPTTCP